MFERTDEEEKGKMSHRSVPHQSYMYAVCWKSLDRVMMLHQPCTCVIRKLACTGYQIIGIGLSGVSILIDPSA